MTAKILKTRIQTCLLIAALPAVPITLRLFYLQTIKHENLSATAARELNRTVSETGPRGRIFDSQGNLLAESIITWDCSLFKKELENPSGTIAALSAALAIPKKELQEKVRKSNSFVSVKKDLGRAQTEAVKALKLKGVRLDPRQNRYYPSGNLARSILGVVGAEKGLTGIELLYDKVLTGQVLHREVIRDAGGRVIYQNEVEGEAAPMDIYLTIDQNIQFFAQEAIKKYAVKNRSDLAMVLVQEPGSGRILAMATYPENLEKIEPVEWVYEPGSTFKTVTVAAALEKNVVTTKDTFYCENGAWAMNNQVTIHDHEPEKNLTLSGVMERSSNIGAAKIGLKLGLENYYLYTKTFGFGTKTGLGFRGESTGILRPIDKYRPVDLAVGSFGHGIAVTPLQVINAYSAVANGGELLETRLVDKITDEGGKPKFKNEPSIIRRVITKETDAILKNILINVVNVGTGKNAGVPGYVIAGKTGTSNKIDPRTGKYITNKNVASFCGFFPADEPRYTILVILDNPKLFYYGGETAAPAFQEIAKKIITLKGIKPDAALLNRKLPPAVKVISD